jgi:hypothetical protein
MIAKVPITGKIEANGIDLISIREWFFCQELLHYY